MRVVLVGAPGAGKGTQAHLLSSHFAVPAVSTGDIFRANVRSGTELGKLAQGYLDRGDLVPDEVTIAMVRDRLGQPDVEEGFLLDGFPRTVSQAESLDELLAEWKLEIDVVLELVVDNDEVVRRLSGRRVCSGCGHAWHVDFDPPRTADICDLCGGALVHRSDDNRETIRHRLEVYEDQTFPLVAFYARRRQLVGIDATGPMEDVTSRAVRVLRRL